MYNQLQSEDSVVLSMLIISNVFPLVNMSGSDQQQFVDKILAYLREKNEMICRGCVTALVKISHAPNSICITNPTPVLDTLVYVINQHQSETLVFESLELFKIIIQQSHRASTSHYLKQITPLLQQRYQATILEILKAFVSGGSSHTQELIKSGLSNMIFDQFRTITKNDPVIDTMYEFRTV